MKFAVISFLLLFSFRVVSANENTICVKLFLPGDSIVKDSLELKTIVDSANFSFQVEDLRKKRVVAAALAFPLPFGFLGLHRIYLGIGNNPWVPVIYLCTLGGGFGILPLIDFFEIIFSSDEDFKSFEQNEKIFMWQK